MMAISDGVLFTSSEEGFLFPVLEAGLHNIPIFVPSLETISSWARNYSIIYPTSASPYEISKIIGEVFAPPSAARKFLFRTQHTWDRVFSEHFAPLASTGREG